MDSSWFEPDQQATMSYIGLRRSIGGIALSLPVVLPVGTALVFHEHLASSISGYYYTDMRGVFVGSMWAIGVFLLSYKFGRLDNLVGNVAGISAIGLSVFPTTPAGELSAAMVASGIVHYAFAAVLFAMLAVFCLVLFVRGAPEATDQKKIRNGIYRVCGVLIVVSMVVAATISPFLDAAFTARWRPLFWLESVAVVSFGVSWLIKGETLFRDPPRPIRPVPPSAQATV